MKTLNTGRYVEKLDHLYIACGDIKYYSHSGKPFGHF